MYQERDQQGGFINQSKVLQAERARAVTAWRGQGPDSNAAGRRDDAPAGDSRPAAETAHKGTAPSDRAPGDKAQASRPDGAGRGRARKRGRKPLIFAVAGAVILTAAVWYGIHYLTIGRYLLTTDDAYVRAHNTTLAAKVSGYVSSIRIGDNAPVRAGEVIATIDDGDYKLAVDAAREKVATQTASVERIGRQVLAQQANVEQARAQLVSAEAAQKRAQSEFERQQALAGKEFASKQTYEQALAGRDQANAAVQSAQASLEAAQANVDVLKSQQQEAARTLDELKTALAKAERDLSFTVIRAPIDGVFGNRAVQTGDFVQTGQRLGALVPLDDVFIDANFKETQLARLRPGQPADIAVDAVPGHNIRGTVESLSPASGSVFSLLPPENATGNFTKIVQRLPVRIRVPADVAAQQILRPGMSVVVSVNTKGLENADGRPASAQMPIPPLASSGANR
ncbi:MAG TPA: HlyD family secretion protein [Pseudorhodoplanes sp.]|jgi:membrane fusion protein (multidrug efflux system)|nr:HlyD family secretion protein [Pseudorhodoplanes sp.]